MGQEVYGNKGDAREGANTEVINLTTNYNLSPEIKFVWSFIFESRNAYDNEVKGRIVTTDAGEDAVDFRSTTISRTAVSGDSHSSLIDLDFLGSGHTGFKQQEYSATTAPTVNNDSLDTAGIGRAFNLGDIWVDTVTNNGYICVDTTATLAIWISSTTYLQRNGTRLSPVTVGDSFESSNFVDNEATLRVGIGTNALKDAAGDGNTAVGILAGGRDNTSITMDGIQNTCVGAYAGNDNEGSNNSIIGYGAGQNNKASKCVLIGFATGGNNELEGAVIIGDLAGYNSTVTSLAIGQSAGQTNTGTVSTFVGVQAGKDNSGTGAHFFGYSAGRSNSGIRSQGFGYYALNNNSGDYTDALGYYALYVNAGVNCVGVGNTVGYRNKGNYLTAIGSESGFQNGNTLGLAHNCTFVGNRAGYTNEGANCVGLGDGALTANATDDRFQVRNVTNILLEGDFSAKSLEAKGDFTALGVIKSTGDIKAIAIKSAAYTLTENDRTIIIDGSSAAVTITLPAAPNTGQVYNLKSKDSTSTVTIARNAKNIEGAASDLTLATLGKVTLQYDGVDSWWSI